ncbi:MAG: carbohydrate kinase family protein [Candidatus Altiarchaeota archaeon]|nr:carbohydrate kinase family protein [Candidatus Altiarchaeota archaeon]
MDVTSVGDVNVDLVTSKIKDYPERDTQLLLSGLHLTSGGCSANYAKAAASLGLKTRFIGRIGSDLFGGMLVKELGSLKNLDFRVSEGGRTAVTLALAFKDGTRSFLTYTGANARLSIKDVDIDLIAGRYLHVGSFFIQGLRRDTKKLLDAAHGKGMLASFDTGFDPAGWSRQDVSSVRKVLADVDMFFPNLREAEALTGLKGRDEICDFLLGMGPSIVALKMGGKGSYVCGGSGRFFIPPFKVDVADSTGAGDVYAAGFVYGRSRGWGLKKSGVFASAAAALSTRGFGSSRYPSRREVSAFLRSAL